MVIPQSLFRRHSWTWQLTLPKISSVLMAYFNSAALDTLSGVYGFSDRSQGFYLCSDISRAIVVKKNKEKKHPFYFCRGQNWEQPTCAAAASVQPAHPAATPPSQHSTQLIRHCFFIFFWLCAHVFVFFFALSLACLIYTLGRRIDLKWRNFVGFSNKQKETN